MGERTLADGAGNNAEGTGNEIAPAGDTLETREQSEGLAPGGAIHNMLNFKELNGAPERIRTSDPQIRSLSEASALGRLRPQRPLYFNVIYRHRPVAPAGISR